MKVYFGLYNACPRCHRPDTIGRIPRRGWMRLVPGSKHISCLACNMDFVIIGGLTIREDLDEHEIFATEDRCLYVHTDRDEIYGPFDMEELVAQASDARLAPGFAISDDQEEWIEACEVNELGMDWLVRFPDGTEYGPVHINAVKELFRTGQIDNDAAAMHKTTRKTVWVADL